jgi:hypothetical protein
MTDPKKASWWQTLPGVLTGVAALITAIVGLLALLAQQGMLGRKEAVIGPLPSQLSADAGASPAGTGETSASPAPVLPGAKDEVRAGHYVFRLLDMKVEPYATGADGKPTSVALRLSIRVTDVMGVTDYVDRLTIRLAVDGAELIPENSINLAVMEKQAVVTEALFIVPADARRVELLVGRASDATARIPLEIQPARTS